MISPLPSLFVTMAIVASVQNEIYQGQYYDKELLLQWNTKGNQPCNLNVHKRTNTLFFCFNRPARFDSALAFYNIDTKDAQNIMGIKKGCAIAIDQENDIVYLGGLSGIYKFNMESQQPEFYAEKGVYIMSLFYRDRLYYIRHPDRKLFMEFEGQFVNVAEFVELQIDHFHITRAGLVYFAVQGVIYVYDQNHEWNLKGLREITAVNVISEDNAGTVYVCTDRGVYIVVNNGLHKFMSEKDILGLTADRDNNLIVADSLTIFRLLKSEPV